MVLTIPRRSLASLPAWVETPLAALPKPKVKNIGLQATDASSLEQLFGKS